MSTIDLKSKLGIGTAQFGMPYGISNQSGQTSKTEVAEILKVASNAGITLVDTASAYGNAEKILGDNELEDFDVVSKFMPYEENGTITKQVNQTLENLKITSLYGYLAHRPSDLVKNEQQWEQLLQLKREKLVKKVGFSLNTPEEFYELKKSGFVPDIVQAPFNYFDRRFEDILIELSHEGCEIHTRSAFLQGLFFMRTDTLGEFFEEVKSALQKIQIDNKVLSGSLLNFVLEKPFIDKVVIGVENKGQLVDNLSQLANSTSLPVLEENISEQILIPSNWPKK